MDFDPMLDLLTSINQEYDVIGVGNRYGIVAEYGDSAEGMTPQGDVYYVDDQHPDYFSVRTIDTPREAI